MFIEPSYSNIGHRGWIEVIVGPMFSGKTEELIRRIKRAQIARQPVGLFKSPLDKRYSEEAVVSHDQNNIPSVDINKAMDTFQHVGNARVVGFDEAQFFDDQLVDVARQLALYNYRVIVAGLDMDYEGKPFSHAICVQCRNLATHSFRKADADQQIMVGAAEAYEPRCRKCFHDGMADKACE